MHDKGMSQPDNAYIHLQEGNACHPYLLLYHFHKEEVPFCGKWRVQIANKKQEIRDNK